MPDIASATAPNALQDRLGYRFADPDLLRAALVHTSYVNEHAERALESNERLEFLGDAVLGALVAHRLYAARPASAEGDLTVLRAWLVRQSTLARWAREIRLGEHLLLGRGEARGGGRDRSAILARGLESLLGAVYLDGGFEAARGTVEPWVDRELASGFNPQRVVDAKSRLQQVCQARFASTPEYRLLQHEGPGHAPTFVFEVHVGPDLVAVGRGASKRVAQQAAAHAALRQLDDVDSYEAPEEPETETDTDPGAGAGAGEDERDDPRARLQPDQDQDPYPDAASASTTASGGAHS